MSNQSRIPQSMSADGGIKLRTKSDVIKGNVDPKELITFQTPMYFLKKYRSIKKSLSEYLTVDFRYDWLFKQWDTIFSLPIPVDEIYTLKNAKRVIGSVKTVRIPRTEVWLRELFSNRLSIKLPKASPATVDDVKHYDEECFKRFESIKRFEITEPNAFYRALESTLKQAGFLSMPRFKLLSVDEAHSELPSDTSSCYPVMVRKNRQEARAESLKAVKKMLSLRENPKAIMKEMFSNVLVVFHRTQIVITNLKPFKSATKIRQVFGLAYSLLTLECMLFSNFYKSVRANAKVVATGKTRIEVSRIVRTVRNAGPRYVICGDFSKFDSTIPSQLVSLYFSCVIQCSRIPKDLKFLASCLANYLTFTPFIGSDCVVRYMFGGNASGMYSTSMLNSFINLLINQYAHIRYFGDPLEDSRISVQGDDFIVSVSDKAYLKFLTSVFSEFGFVLNVGKSEICDTKRKETIAYLGFQWSVTGVPDNELEWVIAHTVYPERNIEGLSGFDRVVYRLCSVIFQIVSGPKLFDRLIYGSYQKFRDKINAEKGKYPIRIVRDDGSVSDTVIPFQELYQQNWTLF